MPSKFIGGHIGSCLEFRLGLWQMSVYKAWAKASCNFQIERKDAKNTAKLLVLCQASLQEARPNLYYSLHICICFGSCCLPWHLLWKLVFCSPLAIGVDTCQIHNQDVMGPPPALTPIFPKDCTLKLNYSAQLTSTSVRWQRVRKA